AQLGLGLSLELRLLDLDRDDAGESLTHIVAREPIDTALLEESGLASVVVDRAGQRRLEPGQVGTTFMGIDGVDEAERAVVVAVVVLQRHFEVYLFADGRDVDGLGVQRLAVAAQELDEGFDTTFVM